MERCYVTVVSGSLSYLPGVAVLNQSLRRVGSEYPLVCLIERQLACREAVEYLEFLGVRVRIVESIRCGLNPGGEDERGSATFTKVAVANPGYTGANKVVLIDADTVIMQNIDSIFGMPGFTSTGGRIDFIQSNLVVVEPSDELWQRILGLLVLDSKPTCHVGDEILWNWLVPDWVHRDELKVGPEYCVWYYPFIHQSQGRFEEIAYNDIKAVHWGGMLKYWSLYRGDMYDGSDASKIKMYIASLEKEITAKLTEAQFSSY
jgi:hypothetical protein